jgi:hypothetical protein
MKKMASTLLPNFKTTDSTPHLRTSEKRLPMSNTTITEMQYTMPEIQAFANRVELKRVQFSEFASHETNCFEAEVHIDNVYVGVAQNEGRGGSTWVDTSLAKPWNTAKTNTTTNPSAYVEAFNKELGKHCWIVPESSSADPIMWSLDDLLDYLLEDWKEVEHLRKWVQTKTRTEVLFKLEGDKLHSWRTVSRNFKLRDPKSKEEEDMIVRQLHAKYHTKLVGVYGLRSDSIKNMAKSMHLQVDTPKQGVGFMEHVN